MNVKFSCYSLVLAAAMSTSALASSSANIVYVLDVSNSMWGQIDGVSKIDTARTAMRSMLDDIDPESKLALVAYGHRSKGDCNDIEVIARLGELENQQILNRLDGLTPTGKTPISSALAAAGGVFETNDAINQVVLISDGMETCGGTPCEAAKTLAAIGAETKVHAVGFDVDASAREQLKCIADAGRGLYLDASDASSLNTALAEVTRVAQVITPVEPPVIEEPAEPVLVSAYLDDFDPDMAGDWSVNNPNPDGFIVEDSNLLILNAGPAGFGYAETENFMTLDPSVLPSGDWDAVMTFSGELKTGRDSLWFGLWKDPDNFLGAQLWANKSRTNSCDGIGLNLMKMSSGTETKSETPLIGDFGCGGPSFEEFDAFMARFAAEPAQLSMHKRGRSYYATIALGEEGADNYYSFTSDKLTSLRSPGGLAISVGVFNPEGAKGETLLFVDKVEIISVE